MRKKKMSAMVAWMLTAAMVTSPVNVAWAEETLEAENSQVVESFTDEGQGGNVSDEMASEVQPDTEESQQEDVSDVDMETSDELTVPDAEENAFSDGGNSVETFSAGETDYVRQTITKAGTYSVNPGVEFSFQPEKTATYKFSVQSEKGIEYGNFVQSEDNPRHSRGTKALKCVAGKSYIMHISPEDRDVNCEDDVKIIIEEIKSITKVTVDDGWKDSITFPLENEMRYDFEKSPKVTLTFDDDTTITTASAECGDYGYIYQMYKDAQGNLVQDGFGNPVRPKNAGNYTYYYYCGADSSIKSNEYKCTYQPFETLFENNIVSRDEGSSDITVRLQDRCDYYYNDDNCYGFVITGGEEDETYINCSEDEELKYGYFKVYQWDEEEKCLLDIGIENSSFVVSKGKKYYVIYITDETLPTGSKLELSSSKNDVKSIEVEGLPKTLIYEFGNYTPANAKVNITYTDGKRESLAYNEVSDRVGKWIYKDPTVTDGESGNSWCELTFTFSKNKLVSNTEKIPLVHLSEIKDLNDIPAASLDKETELSGALYNGNIFKFTAVNEGYYRFLISGKTEESLDQDLQILTEDGESLGDVSFYRNYEHILLKKGETVYVAANGYIGKVSVKVKSIPIVTGEDLIDMEYSDSNNQQVCCIFRPKETGTYKFSLGAGSEEYYINLSDNSGHSVNDSPATLKFEADKDYEVYVFSASGNIETDNITVTVKKVPSIKSISINNHETGNSVYLLENIFEVPRPSITVELDDGQKIDSKDMGKEYGWPEYIILNEKGEDVSDSDSSLEKGNYKYRYYYRADQSVTSPDYDVVYDSFEDYFKENTINSSDNDMNVTLHTGIYGALKYSYGEDKKWYYGFVINGEEQDTYYKIDTEDADNYHVYIQDDEGEWNYSQSYTDGYIKIKGSQKAYVLYSSEDRLQEDKTVNLTRMENNITKVEWVKEPSDTIIDKYLYFSPVDMQIKVTYKNGDSKSLTYGELNYTSFFNDDDEREYHFYALDDPYAFIEKTVAVKPLSKVAEDLPEIKLGKEVTVEHNYNGNVFKFTAVDGGTYNIQISGDEYDTTEEKFADLYVAHSDGNSDAIGAYTMEGLKRVSLKKGDILYAGMEGFVGDIKVKITLAETPSPAPNPDPIVTPRPNPDPVVTPNPTPQPTQTPTPSPSPTPSPEPSQVPIVSEAKVQGNKAEVTLEEDMENVEGYDFVLCANEKDLAAKKYLVVKKNVKKPETSFSYLQKGTYYVYCHGWTKVNGKKVFTEWSEPFEITVNAKTVDAPKILNVRVSKHKVVVKLSKDEEAAGVDIVLGTKAGKDEYGKKPENYGKRVKKNKTGTTIIFTNVPSGTYYVGAHAYIRNEDDNKKSFSKWSNLKKFSVK